VVLNSSGEAAKPQLAFEAAANCVTTRGKRFQSLLETGE